MLDEPVAAVAAPSYQSRGTRRQRVRRRRARFVRLLSGIGEAFRVYAARDGDGVNVAEIQPLCASSAMLMLSLLSYSPQIYS